MRASSSSVDAALCQTIWVPSAVTLQLYHVCQLDVQTPSIDPQRIKGKMSITKCVENEYRGRAVVRREVLDSALLSVHAADHRLRHVLLEDVRAGVSKKIAEFSIEKKVLEEGRGFTPLTEVFYFKKIVFQKKKKVL